MEEKSILFLRPMSETSEYISTAEAAKILGVGVVRVHQLQSQGILPCEKNHWGWRLFLREDVEELVRKRAAVVEARAALRSSA